VFTPPLAVGVDATNPKILEAIVIGNARRLQMASKLRFPPPSRHHPRRANHRSGRWTHDNRRIHLDALAP
jgi:hypothetical protein